MKKVLYTVILAGFIFLSSCSSHSLKNTSTYRMWGYIGCKIWDSYSGVKVRRIIPGGPAEKGGLKPGDIVIKANSRFPETTTKFVYYIRSRLPGTKLILIVKRDGSMYKIKMIIGKYPEDLQLYEMIKNTLIDLDIIRGRQLITLFEKNHEKSKYIKKIIKLKKGLKKVLKNN